MSTTIHQTVILEATSPHPRGVSAIHLPQKKRFRVSHLGQMIKDAVKKSSLSTREVSRQTRLSESTIYRLYKTPNVGVRDIVMLSEKCPRLYLKQVFEEAEKILGTQIPENPYRRPVLPADENPGINITIDTARWGDYKIPPNLAKMVADLIQEYNRTRGDDPKTVPSK